MITGERRSPLADGICLIVGRFETGRRLPRDTEEVV